MPYCAQQDLIDRFGGDELIQLTDRSTPLAGLIDAVVVGRAIADADALIDSYLAGRYTLPLAAVSPILERKACDLARYYLYEDGPTEIVQANYDQALAWLRALTRGDASLGNDAAGSQPASQDQGPEMVSGGRIFGRGTR